MTVAVTGYRPSNGSGADPDGDAASGNARPNVSPDGRRVVFSRELDGNIDIHVLTLEE